jgi:UDP-GlcNAc:undecaprenyl-phosphate GlcNAc-1-phosphate transferase
VTYLVVFLVGAALTALLVPPVRRFAFKIGAVDEVSKEKRKIHTRPIARAGGLAIASGFVLTSLLYLDSFSMQYIGLLVAGLMVLLVGLVDDIWGVNPWVKLAVHIVAALAASLGFGITIDALSNPFGQTIVFSTTLTQLNILGMSLSFSVAATVLTVLWLVGMTNTMNLLDGLDGLSSGVAAIAAIIMFFVAVGPRVNQPGTAQIALVLAGCCLGYLVYNFYPASIFNGDSGAYFLGMTLGILAIFSGAKLATAMLVLGLPIIDTLWAVVRRIASGRSPFSADRGHIHHLLLDSGLNQRQSVLVIYGFSVVFGIIALVASRTQKLIAFGCLVLILTVLIGTLTVLRRKRAARG